jgi:hypothetical protein
MNCMVDSRKLIPGHEYKLIAVQVFELCCSTAKLTHGDCEYAYQKAGQGHVI